MSLRLRTQTFVPLALLCVIARPTAAADPPTPDDIRFFEMRVRVLLAEKCFRCHGPEKQTGELWLDSAEAFKKGGGPGNPLFVPGKPDESLLICAVRHVDGLEKMPPDGKLKDAEIDDPQCGSGRFVGRRFAFPLRTGLRTLSTAKIPVGTIP